MLPQEIMDILRNKMATARRLELGDKFGDLQLPKT
jgi:hypothetical protein